jgi:hypothetical protein
VIPMFMRVAGSNLGAGNSPRVCCSFIPWMAWDGERFRF